MPLHPSPSSGVVCWIRRLEKNAGRGQRRNRRRKGKRGYEVPNQDSVGGFCGFA
ncbi:hypothetical protein PIB30_082070 [Stylosanthes scabra]|uniref:Uncharacterized protein n=1 Tax=Stylosanthes scabra TaxID=79078 RepID=A0ABU6TS87_9FABA|nr:hypothetical protein [Stylosanthes scabra]